MLIAVCSQTFSWAYTNLTLSAIWKTQKPYQHHRWEKSLAWSVLNTKLGLAQRAFPRLLPSLAATLLSCIQQSSTAVASYHISYVVELGLSRILSAIKSPSEQAGDIQLEISYLKFFEVLTSMQGSGACYWSGGKNWQNSHLYLLNCGICVSKDWLSFSNRSLGSTQIILFFLCSSFLTPLQKKKKRAAVAVTHLQWGQSAHCCKAAGARL